MNCELRSRDRRTFRGQFEEGTQLFVSTLSGTYTVAVDAGAAAYGNLSATLHAGHDIVGLASVGNLSGVFSADNNIGEILSFGNISAQVSALNPANLTGGGQIGTVAAWGSIDGSFTASNNLSLFNAGDAITAVRSAPTMGTVLPFDPYIFTTHTFPTMPGSIKADVQADGAQAYAELLADKALFQSDVAAFLTDIGNDQLDATTSVEQARQTVAASNPSDLTENQTAVAMAQAQADQELATDLQQSATDQQQFADAVDSARSGWQVTIVAEKAAQETAFAASVAEAIAEGEKTATRISEANAKRSQLLTADDQARAIDQDWQTQINAKVWGAFKTGVQGACMLIIPTPIALTVTGIQIGTRMAAVVGDYAAQADAYGYTGFQHAYHTFGNAFMDAIGVSAAWEMVCPADPFADHSWSNKKIIVESGLVLIEVATSMALGGLYSRFTSPCGSWFGGECFFGDTQVHLRHPPAGAIVADAAPIRFIDDSDESSDLTVVLYVVAGIAGFMLLERRRTRFQVRRLVKSNPPRCLTVNAQRGDGECNAPQYSELPTRVESEQDSTDALFVADNCPTWFPAHESELAISRESQPRRSLGLAWLVACLLLGLGNLLPVGNRVRSDLSSGNVAMAAAPQAAHEVLPTTMAIRDLRIGRRLLANNPELAGQHIPPLIIDDPYEWRDYTVHLDKPAGGDVLIHLLERLEWLSQNSLDNEHVRIDLPEMGVSGTGRILKIDPCPAIEPDDGTGRRLITATFQHSAANVLDVHVEGEPKPLGVTSNHSFWSEDQKAFIPAGELQPS